MKRLEHLKREFQFIERLDNRDVDYILTRKKEQATIVIQRNFRARKARREARRTDYSSNTAVAKIVWDQLQKDDIQLKKDNLEEELKEILKHEGCVEVFDREFNI